jgi:hypothetical protein
MVSRPVLVFQHSTKFTANPPKLVALYFDCMSAPVWRGGDDAVQRDAVRTVVQRQRRRDDRLDHGAAYPVTVNQWIEFPDNFLPKTRGGLMVGRVSGLANDRARIEGENL